MKVKNALRLLLTVLSMLIFTGCDNSFPFFSQDSVRTIDGKVNSIENDSVFIQVGIREEAEKDTDVPVLEFTEEEQEIRMTKDTVIRLQEAEDAEELSAADLREGDVISISLDKKENPLEIRILSRGRPDIAGRRRESENYDALTEFVVDTETDGEKYASTGTDENAVHVFGEARVNLKNAELTRTSWDSTGGSTSSIYGVGAALLTTSGISCIQDSTISTNAPGGSGIFSYGDGVTYAMNTTVATRQEVSCGIQTTYGGELYAWNLDVETEGESSAAIRSEWGGGTMVVDGGSYRTKGTGSPAVYCMSDIAIHEAELTADASEAVSIEGGNALHLYDCELTGNMGDNLSNDSTWNVLLHQSMSEDYDTGSSIFEMEGGTLNAKNGGIFYTTNTDSSITLSKVKIVYPNVKDFFLKCTGNDHQGGWGEAGSNGSVCVFTAASQDMEGDVIWDGISRLDFYMSKNSRLKGAVLKEKSQAGVEEDGYCNLYIEEGSTWIVTGNSILSRLSTKGKIVDGEGNTVTVRGTDGTIYVKGTGKYTITVFSYEMAANMSGASEMSKWTDYQAEIPQ